MVTGKPHDPVPALSPSASPPSSSSQPVAFSPPSKRDLASWWRQFKRNTRKEDSKGIFSSPPPLSASLVPVSVPVPGRMALVSRRRVQTVGLVQCDCRSLESVRRRADRQAGSRIYSDGLGAAS